MSDPINGTTAPGEEGGSSGSDSQRVEETRGKISSPVRRKRTVRVIPPKPPELVRLPGVVWRYWNSGRVVIPQYLRDENHKAPCIDNLTRFDDRNLTLEELIDATNRKWAFWGVRLGPQTGYIALDFDERHGGMETFERLGLPAHVETPRGGRHIYIKHPGWPVPSIAQPGPDGFEGMEVLGDKHLVTFYSRLPSHPYTLHSQRLIKVDQLTNGLGAVLSEHRRRKVRIKRNPTTNGAKTGRRLPRPITVMLEKLGDTVRETRPGQWEGLCPLHDDTEPSFGFGLGDDRLVVISCAAQDHKLSEFADYFGLTVADFSRKPSVEFSSGAPGVLGAGPWPTLGTAAMYGLSASVVEQLAPYTEAAPVGMLTSFLTIFGALVGPGPHFEVEGANHPARLFVVHVGETARSRKGTNYKIIKLVFKNNEYWHENFEFSGLATGEGLVKDLTTAPPPSGKLDASTPKGPDKRRLIVETEFARVLTVASRDGNSLSALLRQAYDGDDLAVKTRHEPLRAAGASVSMLGQITSEELQKRLTDTEVANGFANRYLYVCLRTSKELPEGGHLPGNLRGELEQEVNDAIQRARRLGNVVLSRTDAARERWAELYHEYRESPHQGLLGAVTRRAEAQSMRLSVAYALIDGSAVIDTHHVEAGHALWSYCEASAAHIFGGSTGNADADRIWHALGATESKELSRTAISALFARNVSKERIEGAVAVLLELGLVRSWTERSGGRPREMLGVT